MLGMKWKSHPVKAAHHATQQLSVYLKFGSWDLKMDTENLWWEEKVNTKDIFSKFRLVLPW